MTSRSDRARLKTVRQLKHHLEAERVGGDSESLMKEVWEELPHSQLAAAYDERDRVVSFREEREKALQ